MEDRCYIEENITEQAVKITDAKILYPSQKTAPHSRKSGGRRLHLQSDKSLSTFKSEPDPGSMELKFASLIIRNILF